MRVNMHLISWERSVHPYIRANHLSDAEASTTTRTSLMDLLWYLLHKFAIGYRSR